MGIPQWYGCVWGRWFLSTSFQTKYQWYWWNAWKPCYLKSFSCTWTWFQQKEVLLEADNSIGLNLRILHVNNEWIIGNRVEAAEHYISQNISTCIFLPRAFSLRGLPHTFHWQEQGPDISPCIWIHLLILCLLKRIIKGKKDSVFSWGCCIWLLS